MQIRRRDGLAIAAIVLAAGLVSGSPAFDLIRGLSLDVLTALRWQVFGPRHDPAQAPAVVVGIDEASFEAAPFAGSPTVTWTREIGRVLTALVDDGQARAVGFDIIFPTSIEQSEMPFGDGVVGERLRGFDRDFLRALHAAAGQGRVVLGEMQHPTEPIRPAAGQRIAVGQPANLRALNVFSDADGVVRRLPLGFSVDGQVQASMAVELAARALGVAPRFAPDGGLDLGGYAVPSAQPHTMTLNFDGAADDVMTYSLADLRACIEAGDTAYFRRQFAGKVVLLGTLLDTEDRKATTRRLAGGAERSDAPRCALPAPAGRPAEPRSTISGVYIHATAVNNLIRREAVTEFGRLATTALATGLAAVTAWGALMLTPAAAGLAFVGIAATYVATAVLVFSQSMALPLVEPLLAALGALLATAGYRFVVADKEERLLRKGFAMYLAPQLIDKMVESDSLPTLGGELRHVTVLFSDIVGFTTIAEAMTPQALVALMNHYLSAMAEIIEDAGGYVDKYVGDSIVAVFGAPLDDPDHALHAVSAALACRERLEQLNEAGDAFAGHRIRHRIGINSGEALLGNIGSRRRFNYTVMGDAVNLASRLEGANRYYSTSILASQATVALTGDAFAWREIDDVRVKGSRQPVKVFDVLARRGEQTTHQTFLASVHAAGLAAWRTRAFADAAAHFARIAGSDPVAASFELRARRLVEQPPKPDWEPITSLDGK